jgi:site-specific recombinase XerD
VAKTSQESIKEEDMKIWNYSLSYRIDGEGELILKANSFLEKAEIHGLSSDTARAYAFALMAFFKYLEMDYSKLEKFTQENLQAWMGLMNKSTLKPRSINHRLTVARAFYRFCFGKEVPHHPGVIYPHASYRSNRMSNQGRRSLYRPNISNLRVKVPYVVVAPLTPEEVDKFLRSIYRYRDLSITLTMLLCGLRSLEVLKLKVSDVNFQQSSLKVTGKGKRERILPMPLRLMQIFERYLQVERPDSTGDAFFVVLQGKKTGEPMSREGLRSIFRYHRGKTGLTEARAHKFRHTFASDMARSGVSLTTIQKLLGHSDPRISLIYIELFLDDIRAEYDQAMKRIEERYAALKK